MPTDRAIRILLADDHTGVRALLKQMLNDAPDMRVVADTGDGTEAIRLATELSPTIALVDISMREPDGVAITRTIAERCAHTRIIALTRHSDNAFVERMFEVGATGYVLKQSASSELLAAIRAVACGASYIDSSLLTGHTVVAAEPHAISASPVALEPLTVEEVRVLRPAALMLTTSEISQQIAMPVAEVRRLKAAGDDQESNYRAHTTPPLRKSPGLAAH